MAWSIDRAYDRIGAKDSIPRLELLHTVTYVDAKKTRGRGSAMFFCWSRFLNIKSIPTYVSIVQGRRTTIHLGGHRSSHDFFKLIPMGSRVSMWHIGGTATHISVVVLNIIHRFDYRHSILHCVARQIRLRHSNSCHHLLIYTLQRSIVLCANS